MNRQRRSIFLFLVVIFSCAFLWTQVPRPDRHPTPAPPPAPASVHDFLQAVRPLTMNHAERARMLSLIKIVDRLLRRHKVAYFLGGGSAIGAMRHGGLVPFDDDFDIYVLESSRKHLEQLVFTEGNLKEVGLEVMATRRFTKIFFRQFEAASDVKYKEFNYRWPWLDVWFLYSNDSHVTAGENPMFPQDDFRTHRREVFPLVEVDVEGLSLPMMRCFRLILERLFPGVMEKCCSGNWNHRKEDFFHPSRKGVCIACSALRGTYPFVERIDAEREAVKIGDRVLRTRFLRQEDGCRFD